MRAGGWSAPASVRAGRWSPPVAVWAAGLTAVLLLIGCTGGGSSSPSPSRQSRPPTSAQVDAPPARSTIITTPAGVITTGSNATEVDGTCPYISDAEFQEYEGDHVGRVTVLQTKPVGCRFYFGYDESQIIGEVLVQTFADAVTANNSMVLAAKGHAEVQSDTGLGAGAVAYRTPLQGKNTWQCLVTVGSRVYTVRTRQDDTARDAFNLAAALVRTVS